MASTFANKLRALAAEFAADRDYQTVAKRTAFRSELFDALHRAAWNVEDLECLRHMPLPPDELDGLGFDNRTLNALRNSLIVTVAQIARAKDEDLQRIPNLGKLSLKRLRGVIPYVEQGRPRVRVSAGRSIN